MTKLEVVISLYRPTSKYEKFKFVLLKAFRNKIFQIVETLKVTILENKPRPREHIQCRGGGYCAMPLSKKEQMQLSDSKMPDSLDCFYSLYPPFSFKISRYATA